MSTDTSSPEKFYEAHIFCCINERVPDHPRGSCAARGSVELHQYMKTKSKELGIEGIRVNKAGCLDRCELGPVVVIYPEGVWYSINSNDDIDQILERHILNGERVEHLTLAVDQELPKPTLDLTPSELQLRVGKIEQLTDDIKSFELHPVNGAMLPTFSAGSHIDIYTADDQRRSYSLVNAPSDTGRYVISALHEPDGRGGSHWLHTALSEGDNLRVVPPENQFPLVENASEHLFIAGGIGIAPILSMGRHLKEQNAPATLHYCTKSPELTAFHAETASAFDGQVTYHHDNGDPSKGINLAETLKNHADGTHLYICGPRGLIDAAREAASHWPEGTVHFELFAGADDVSEEGDETFSIVLAKSDMTLEVPPGKSILEVIEDAGVDVDSACHSGICATCQTGLLGGEADHRDEVLSPSEKEEQSTMMICVSRAKPGEKLILDI